MFCFIYFLNTKRHIVQEIEQNIDLFEEDDNWIIGCSYTVRIILWISSLSQYWNERHTDLIIQGIVTLTIVITKELMHL